MIGILDYGSGNVRAIANIYHRLNIPYSIIRKAEGLKKVDKVILPGVGAFDETMNQLDRSGIKRPLNNAVEGEGKPVLGICVGMQIMAKSSDEGEKAGLGWIDGVVKKFDPKDLEKKPKLPHMGWNTATPQNNNQLFREIDPVLGFYFLHSYYFSCSNAQDQLATSKYGIEFSSAVNKGNVYGTQFHPEKSHSNGMQIFKNFANI